MPFPLHASSFAFVRMLFHIHAHTLMQHLPLFIADPRLGFHVCRRGERAEKHVYVFFANPCHVSPTCGGFHLFWFEHSAHHAYSMRARRRERWLLLHRFLPNAALTLYYFRAAGVVGVLA